LSVTKTAASSAIDREAVSHNLLGQRLGRKGRDTRERILAATEKLLASPPGTAITLSAVAREASLGMTTLYLYFSDFTELFLAVLDNIMATAEECYVGRLRERWDDAVLGDHCVEFLQAYQAFWVKHSRALHLRNAFAYNNDQRVVDHRIAVSRPLLELLIRQMDGDPTEEGTPASNMATVLYTGVERMITVTTDPTFPRIADANVEAHVRGLMRAEARLLELGLADGRAAMRKAAAAA
jgi:AcrR family transcriptional regulator